MVWFLLITQKSAEAQPSENASKTVVTDVSCNYCNEEAEKIEQFW